MSTLVLSFLLGAVVTLAAARQAMVGGRFGAADLFFLVVLVAPLLGYIGLRIACHASSVYARVLGAKAAASPMHTLSIWALVPVLACLAMIALPIAEHGLAWFDAWPVAFFGDGLAGQIMPWLLSAASLYSGAVALASYQYRFGVSKLQAALLISCTIGVLGIFYYLVVILLATAVA